MPPCTKCRDRASAVMDFSYAARTVWLQDLHRFDPFTSYPLCLRHADRFAVPTGWRLDDRRAGRLPEAVAGAV